MHGKGGLTDPGHPVDRVDAHHPAATGHGGKAPQQLGQLRLTADERGKIPRQRLSHRGKTVSGYLLPGRQHLFGGDLAQRRGHKQPAYRLTEAQRTGQQPRGVQPGGPVDAPLQITDRPR